MSDAPVWSETISVALTWRKDAWGEEGRALYLNGLCVGFVQRHKTKLVLAYRAWIMSDDDGQSIGWFPTEDMAKAELVEAVKKELTGGL
jgi:hypothetical protein